MATDEIDWASEKTAWCELVRALMQEIKTWADEENWLVSEQEKTLTEDHLGTYAVPGLTVKPPSGYLTVEPIGRDIIGAHGRVDICAFPSMNRMLLVRMDDQWRVKTDAYVPWPKSWCKDTFVELAAALSSTT